MKTQNDKWTGLWSIPVIQNLPICRNNKSLKFITLSRVNSDSLPNSHSFVTLNSLSHNVNHLFLKVFCIYRQAFTLFTPAHWEQWQRSTTTRRTLRSSTSTGNASTKSKTSLRSLILCFVKSSLFYSFIGVWTVDLRFWGFSWILDVNCVISDT